MMHTSERWLYTCLVCALVTLTVGLIHDARVNTRDTRDRCRIMLAALDTATVLLHEPACLREVRR